MSAWKWKALNHTEHKIFQSFGKPSTLTLDYSLHRITCLCSTYKTFVHKINYSSSVHIIKYISVFNLSSFWVAWRVLFSHTSLNFNNPPNLSFPPSSTSEMAWSVSALWFEGILRSHCKHAEGAGLIFQTQDAVCYPLHVTGQPHSNIPDVSERKRWMMTG